MYAQHRSEPPQMTWRTTYGHPNGMNRKNPRMFEYDWNWKAFYDINSCDSIYGTLRDEQNQPFAGEETLNKRSDGSLENIQMFDGK